MIELVYNPTYTFSTADVFDYPDSPPITFEAHARQAPDWARLCHKWASDGANDPERAVEIIGLALVAVEQNGQRYPLNGRDDAAELRAAIERSAPGHGDRWICALARAHWDFHFSRSVADLGNSAAPLEPSANGDKPASKSGPTAQKQK